MKKLLSLLILLTHVICCSPIQLTQEQINQYHDDGYLLIENALDLEEVARLKKTVDGVVDGYEAEEYATQFAHNAHGAEYYNIRNALEYTSDLDYVMDHPRIFDSITTLMGNKIRLVNFNLFIRHPVEKTAMNNKLGLFHVDLGATYDKTREHYPMQINVQIFLTDLLGENEGNLLVIPGTHHPKPGVKLHGYAQLPECNSYLEKGELPPGTVQIKAKAGDVLIHALELWHAVGPNFSKNTRKSIGLRYGQKELKEFQLKVPSDVKKRLNHRRRALVS